MGKSTINGHFQLLTRGYPCGARILRPRCSMMFQRSTIQDSKCETCSETLWNWEQRVSSLWIISWLFGPVWSSARSRHWQSFRDNRVDLHVPSREDESDSEPLKWLQSLAAGLPHRNSTAFFGESSTIFNLHLGLFLGLCLDYFCVHYVFAMIHEWRYWHQLGLPATRWDVPSRNRISRVESRWPSRCTLPKRCRGQLDVGFLLLDPLCIQGKYSCTVQVVQRRTRCCDFFWIPEQDLRSITSGLEDLAPKLGRNDLRWPLKRIHLSSIMWNWIFAVPLSESEILWMEEILHQLVDGLSHCNPIIYSVL